MIPFLNATTFAIGPLTFQVWGTLVALGFIAALLLIYFRFKRLGLKSEIIWDLGLAVLLGVIVGSRLFHVFFYEWGYFQAHLAEIFYFWQPGYSFFGGLAGGIVGFWAIYKLKKIDFWPYADAIIFFTPLGLVIGRIGCFLIHDHPGIKTDFFLGVQYPDGARWDLGLMQLLANLVIFFVFLFLDRRKRIPGFYTSIYFIYYAVTRFGFDFLRVWEGPMAEARYFLLTPAQYLSVILLIVGIVFAIKASKK